MRKLLKWTWIPVILVLAYSGWLFYQRSADNKRIAAEAERKRAEADQKVIEKLGSGSLKILMFYANPPAIRPGEKTLLCYGVSNATAVRIDPPVDGVGPAISQCVEARPRADTTYTLTAEGSDKSRETGTLTVAVK
jgi:hypothetical protein